MIYIDIKKCKNCEECVFVCINNAITIKDGNFNIDQEKCKKCKFCIKVCTFGAIIDTEN